MSRVRRFAEDMTDEEWRGRFDRAVALFNAGEFYDAHEDWEALWLEAEDAHRLWLQGLIQYAAAFVHYSRGFHRLMTQATEKVQGYEGDTESMDWPAFWEAIQPWIVHGQAVAGGAALESGDLPEPPRMAYVAGYAPRPLPLESGGDAES